ncbi:MAG: hypothetical protein ACFFA8_00765 [Promethearchaeota archaeon]
MNFPIFQLNKKVNTKEPFKGIFSIWGEIGVGKTTFALQTAIINALNGKNVIFIYSKPNFPFEKIKNFIQPSSKKILDKILFIQVLDYDDLYTIIFNLEFDVLKNLKANNIYLIVVDSITDLYRLELNRDKKEKNFILNYKLNQILANLYNLNWNYKTEILITTEVSQTKINGRTIQIQAGGKIMEYWINYSLKIERTEKLNHRRLILSRKEEKTSEEYYSIFSEKGFQ